MRKELSDCEIEVIKTQVNEKIGSCRKSNDIIGTQVFSILGRFARVIYYPIGKNAPWGFTRISGTRNDAGLEKPFVVINTSILIPCQVFAAAHELYHIWYEKDPDILPGNILEEDVQSVSERKASRFAAEFLVDEAMLRQEIRLYGIKEYSLKTVLQLANLFTVPYRAMAKRLYETGLIGASECDRLLAEPDGKIEQYRRRYAIPADEADRRIAMDNLAELSVNVYEKGLIRYAKLEYLLALCNLKPEDLGIREPDTVTFPSDEELETIMEEDE